MQALGGHRRGRLLAAAEAVEIKPRRVPHELMHGGAPPRRSQINLGALVSDGGRAADLLAHRADHLLGELHHPEVIAVGLIDLHRGELGVVAGADPFIAEDPAQLIHALKATHHQALEVQLGGNPQGEGQVEGVVMGLERPRVSATGFALQHGGLDLEKVPLIEPAANAAHQAGPTPEGLTAVGGDHQIQVALAVALLNVGQSMPLVGKGLQRLGEHAPVAHFHRQLATVGATQGAAHPKPVATVHQ